MEASSGGADPRRREREGLPLLNGAPTLFSGAAQTLAHRHLNHAGEEPESSSNPDPVSFAFAASSGPPAMTSPAGSKPKLAVRYRECLRNHAASVGGSIFDGCGEFMPGGEEGSLEALKCAACDCHRNFHRKEADGGGESSHHFSTGYRRSGPLQLSAPPALPSPSMVHHPHASRHFSNSLSMVAPMSVAYGGGGSAAAAAAAGTESSSEDLNLFGTPTPTPGGGGGYYFGSSNNNNISAKKRSRTKFSQEQKEKMMEFAEKIGWKMQRQSEEEVERFCAEVGVKRQVFKVWMHNNKNPAINKSSTSSNPIQFQLPSP